MNDNIDYSKLSKEELIELLKKSNETNNALQNKVSELEAIILKQKEIIEFKNFLIKKSGIETYVDTSDNAGCHKTRTGMKDKATGSPRGRKFGSKNYQNMDLETLSKENEVIINDIKDEWMKEHPGSTLIEFGQDETYIIEHIKATIKVHKVITKKYKTENGSIVQSKSNSIISHSYASAGLLAYFVMLKYSLGLPVYRFKDILAQQGLDMSFKTIYGWLMSTADLLKPLWNALKSHLSDGTYHSLNVDETHITVLDKEDINRKECYMYLYSGDTKDKKVRFFDYTCSRKADRCKEILKDYKGAIVVDGYAGYDDMQSDDISLQRCLVHLRRKGTDIRKTLTNEQRKNSEASTLVDMIDKIFEMERQFKKDKLTPLQVLEKRQSEEYEQIQEKLDEKFIELSKCNLSKEMSAFVNYYLNRRYQYWTYLNDGSIECDNNKAERMAKSFQTNARSFLFARTDDSAINCAVLMTIVKTAEANNIYPDDYIEWVLKSLHDGRKVETLLPWSSECNSFKIER